MGCAVSNIATKGHKEGCLKHQSLCMKASSLLCLPVTLLPHNPTFCQGS